jgi:NADPH2:quinone reductase
MKAILSVAPAGPEGLVLAELETPLPGPGEVRIAVRAAGVNYPDGLMIRDLYQLKPPRPFSPGAEVAGVIDAVGQGVDPARMGERVISLNYYGAFVTHFLCKGERAHPIPDEMSFTDGAALLLNYGTAFYALVDRAGIRPGETLFVSGAAGGIGAAAIELGKALGARVIAGVSSEQRASFARQLGADQVLVYPRGPLDEDAKKKLTNDLRAMTDGRGLDVFCDPVGGDYAEPVLRAFAWQGRYLVVGFTAGIPAVRLNLALLKNAEILGVFWGAFIDRDSQRLKEQVQQLVELYRQRLIKPPVTSVYPLEQAAEALRLIEQRQVLGKTVLTVEAQ